MVHSSRHGHHQGREAVTAGVVILAARRVALKHLEQQQVEVDALQAQPREGGQEEVVQEPGENGAGDLWGGGGGKGGWLGVGPKKGPGGGGGPGGVGGGPRGARPPPPPPRSLLIP